MNRIYAFISRSGICAVSGAIAGAFVGGLFGLVEFVSRYPVIAPTVLLELAIGLSLVAWIVVLVVVGVFGNYGAFSIGLQSFVTCVLTGVVTTVLVHATHAGLSGMLLGWIIGFLIGKALCALCYRVTVTREVA